MKKKKVKTKAEIAHHDKVAQLGCYIWHNFPEYGEKECCNKVVVHHQLGQGRDHMKVTCLCENHHSAQTPLPYGYAVHKGTKSFEARYATQQEMVEWANRETLSY